MPTKSQTPPPTPEVGSRLRNRPLWETWWLWGKEGISQQHPGSPDIWKKWLPTMTIPSPWWKRRGSDASCRGPPPCTTYLPALSLSGMKGQGQDRVPKGKGFVVYQTFLIAKISSTWAQLATTLGWCEKKQVLETLHEWIRIISCWGGENKSCISPPPFSGML